ncbi:MAG TPA: transaldolase, partial [Candidatus Melainabacteria bacterium]|nr:transaldolase [Candidatus Melainabacteria bacterium]
TSPEQIKSLADTIEPKKTIFVVASKSGTTLEPNIFMAYFLDMMRRELGEEAGNYFLAITDPDSKLEAFAREAGFKHIFYGRPEIGGRYSALSDFGMIPAALMGIPVEDFLLSARDMVDACRITRNLKSNPGVYLGAVLGAAYMTGRDKMTVATSSGISDLGAWLEQLVAESTGKDGKAIIPVDREHLGSPETYGDDRVFVYLKLESDQDSQQEEALKALAEAGYPVIKILMTEKIDLGREFFRFEVATAVAGAIIGINPFNQPDVEASKIATRALTRAYEEAGSFPPETPLFEEEAIKVFVDDHYIESLGKEFENLTALIGRHLSSIETGDYFALLGYIEMNEEHERLLQNIRHAVRDARKVATCLGFGPRFLHSTGQAYKGGSNKGVFIQLTCDHPQDLDVPDHAYSFGTVIDAQARGDLEVLTERKRRVIRVHLSDVGAGLAQLRKAVTEALT